MQDEKWAQPYDSTSVRKVSFKVKMHLLNFHLVFVQSFFMREGLFFVPHLSFPTFYILGKEHLMVDLCTQQIYVHNVSRAAMATE